MGIIATLKIFAPLSLYVGSLVAMLASFTGRVYIGLAVTILLIPLRNVVEKLDQFPLGSQVIDLLYASMLMGWIFTLGSDKKAKAESFITIPAILMSIYLFISIIIGTFSLTGSFGLDPSETRVQDWKNFTMLPLLFLIMINNLPDKKWAMRIFYVMLGALFLIAYYTVSQVTSYTSLLSRSKISGTFQFLGPNEVAAFLNQTTIILTGMYYCMKKCRLKYLILAIILMFTYCIIFLYSRAAYLGLCAGFLIIFLLKDKKMIIPIIIVLALWQVVLPKNVIDRIKGTTNEYGELDESSELRLVMWQRGLELFQGSPLFGIGYGVFRLMDFGTGLHDTHNIYVKILVEQGLTGFILFFVVVFAFMRQGYQLYQKGDDDISKGLGLGLAVSMITLLINNFFGDRWSYFELSAYTWVFAALATKFYNLTKENSTPIDNINDITVNKEKREPTSQVPKRKIRKSYYK